MAKGPRGESRPANVIGNAVRVARIATGEEEETLLHIYNFVRMHKMLRCTPAMAAGPTDKVWSVEDMMALIDARAEPGKKRGPYKPRAKAA